MVSDSLFDVERDGNVLVIVPRSDLRESAYDGLETGARVIFDLLEAEPITGVVFDFHRTGYYGSTALGLFVRLWKRLSSRGGRMAFCNVSEHEQEILTVTRLGTLWPICRSREEAVRLVRG